MDEQRRQVLQMLAEGKVTAEEAERLIDALEQQQPEARPAATPGIKTRPKYLRVLVEDNSAAEAGRVNIRVPLQLLRAGVRITSLLPPQALTRVNEELAKAGVPIDLTQLRPQDVEELIEQLGDVTVDVEDSSSTVRIFCE